MPLHLLDCCTRVRSDRPQASHFQGVYSGCDPAFILEIIEKLFGRFEAWLGCKPVFGIPHRYLPTVACAIDDFAEVSDCFGVFTEGARDASHGVVIMSALRTSASSIFRIADFSLWLRVAAMTFAEQLSGFTASNLMAAFPGIPRSTAYDWLSGVREPVPYLQPVVLAHLRSASTPNKTPETTRRKRSVR